MNTTSSTHCPPGSEPVKDFLRQGRSCAEQGRAREAARHFLAALQQQPNCFEAYCRLGLALQQLNQLQDAAQCLEAAIRLRPTHPQVHLLLGAVYKQRGDLERAADCCRQEIALTPHNADAHYNLGLMLQNLERPAEALAAYQQSLALRPDYIDALLNLAQLHQDRLDLDAAIACCRQALRSAPNHAPAHWQLGSALLAQGDWAAGWREYEWRWQLKDFTTPATAFSQPRWDGTALAGRRLFLHSEQGFGDIIQFIRFVPVAVERGGEVIVGCPQALQRLLARMPGVSAVTTTRAALPAFALHAPLLSLPAILGTTLATVPATLPYLSPPPTPFPLGPLKPGCLKVGLVWAGDAGHKNDRHRSLPFEQLRPLLDLEGVHYFSLQAGPRAGDRTQAQWAQAITDLGSRFTDFDDTASAIVQLDLVISVDTAVAHLAGALGKPVWTLLPFAAEWRWMTHRSDSPWYPTMRLFRQSQPGDWPGLLRRVRQELAGLRG